jgi:8-oxo-dGTP diphosphatase
MDAACAGRHLVRRMPDSRSPTAGDAVRVLAAVVRRGDRWLICRRPVNKRHGGLWEFPGGKLEPGEDHGAAARREVREELGVAARAVGPLLARHRDPDSPYVIDFVRVEIEGEPAALEHDAVYWATLAELRALPLAPSDRAFVDGLSSGGSRAPAAAGDRPRREP